MASALLTELRNAIRRRQYSIRTEQAYIAWTIRFVRYHNMRHPQELGDAEVASFLTHLAVNRRVAASTQNQALSALVFLYRHVLDRPLGDITGAVRAKQPERLPVVLSRKEVAEVLNQLHGVHQLVGSLLYGSGLRLMEALRLRVKDLDFEYHCLHIRNAKGGKDRVVTLSTLLHAPLRVHLAQVRQLHAADLARGLGRVRLPGALHRKYPNAENEWSWQYVFPSSRISKDPRSQHTGRHHLYPSTFQKAIRRAVVRSGITRPASSHTFRHSFTTHALENGLDIRTVQQQLGARLAGNDRNLHPRPETWWTCRS